jgi:hypothetical protein
MIFEYIMAAKRGFLGFGIPVEEGKEVEKMAESMKLQKASMARALLRAGQILFREDPQLVLTYAPFTRTVD